MNDFSGYTSSLNNTFSQMPQLTKSQQTAEDKIKDYNNRVNQIISPLGDEFVRQSSDIITGGIQKGLKLGFGKKLGSKLVKTTEDSNSNGLLGGDFVNVDKIKPKAQPQKLLRNDTEQATNDFKLKPHSPTRTLGDIDKSVLSDEEKVQLNLERAQQASLRSGQVLRQTGATPDAEVLARAKQKLADQQRPPPAKPAQEPSVDDDDDDDFQDAEEEPNVEETNLDTGEKVVEKDTEKEGEKLIEKKTEKETLKEGERFGEKFAEGEAEGGGPEDPASTILALGLGVASLFAQKKLQKKDITPPPPQQISPNFARGL